MTPVIWWKFIYLGVLHLMVISQKVHLFGPFKLTQSESSCHGPELVVEVDQLFLIGTATNFSSPNLLFQQMPQGVGMWYDICNVNLAKCTGDNNTRCDCDKRDNNNYTLHLNMTVNALMGYSFYRLSWLDQSGRLKTSESLRIPKVWSSEREIVSTHRELQYLKTNGNCEILFHPNVPASYCVLKLQEPFSIRIISWNIRKDKIVSKEVISPQGCVSVSSYSESGVIVAYTEFTGCRRRRSRYCSIKATDKEPPNPCEEEKKLIPKYEVNGKQWRFDDKICSCNVLHRSPQTSIRFCMPPHNEPYVLKMYNNERVLNTTHGPCITSDRPYFPGHVTFRFNGSCPTPRLFTCKINTSEKASVNLTVKNQTLDLSGEFCNFTLREDVNVSMTVCVLKKQAPYNVTIVLGDIVMELTNFLQDCVSLYHTPSAATFQPNYQFIFLDRCQNNVTLICTGSLSAKEPPERAGDDGGKLYFAIVISGIIIIALLLVMCLKVASLLLRSKKWQETEDAVVENDEGDEDHAPKLTFFDVVEYVTTEVSELGNSFTESQVDSVTTQSTEASSILQSSFQA